MGPVTESDRILFNGGALPHHLLRKVGPGRDIVDDSDLVCSRPFREFLTTNEGRTGSSRVITDLPSSCLSETTCKIFDTVLLNP